MIIYNGIMDLIGPTPGKKESFRNVRVSLRRARGPLALPVGCTILGELCFANTIYY
jgi:hypothetical protein